MATEWYLPQLTLAITQAVQEYTEAVTAAIEKEVEATSKQVLAEIKSSAPERTGKYRKAFARAKVSERGSVKYVIYNRLKPHLTHLLEKGHAKRGGGRVAARPHLAPAYDKHVPAMEERIKEIIRNGG